MKSTQIIPRPEHPKPQFLRENWINLNGPWSYVFDHGKSGMNEGRDLFKSTGFSNSITVPFCPESELSGVGHTDFIDAMWYHRSLQIPKEWSEKLVILHFGGVDYECEVFVDGVSAGIHYGGTVSFSFDITKMVEPGNHHDLVIRVLDDPRFSGQPRGKQSYLYKSHKCLYTRTTGIWQTVWLESVSKFGLTDCQIVPDLDEKRFVFTPAFYTVKRGLKFRVTVKGTDKIISEKCILCSDNLPVIIQLEDPIIWEQTNPFLYDFIFEVINSEGTILDKITSYGGLRKIHIEENRIYLNNKPLYTRFVLDQGFYPDGIWTAPTDEALNQDIILSMKAGFNGARLHQKVFEERFHYWADKLGYLTWGESARWVCNVEKVRNARNFLSEWSEIILRDRNHPSIIAWTPLNETAIAPAYNDIIDREECNQHHRLHVDAYNLTKALDPTRPVNDASGYNHVKTDLWTVHHYERGDKLPQILSPQTEDGVFHRSPEHEVKYDGQPYLIDEFGGLKWVSEVEKIFASNTWGYGDNPQSEEQFYTLLEEEVDAILAVKNMCGYCYTQLTDVEQEQNGIYNYDRTKKFDMKRIRKIFSKEGECYEIKD